MNRRRDALRRGIRSLIQDTSRELATLAGPDASLAGDGGQGPAPAQVDEALAASEAAVLERPAESPSDQAPPPSPPPAPHPAVSDPIARELTSPAPLTVPTPAGSSAASQPAIFTPGPQQMIPAAPPGLPPPPIGTRPETPLPTPDVQTRRQAPPSVPTAPTRETDALPQPPQPAARLSVPTQAVSLPSAARQAAGRQSASRKAPGKKTARGKAPPASARKAGRLHRRPSEEVVLDGVHPQQAHARKGVCFAYFINKQCWRVPQAYCNTALHVCVLRECPVYHLHKGSLERRFAEKYKHFW